MLIHLVRLVVAAAQAVHYATQNSETKFTEPLNKIRYIVTGAVSHHMYPSIQTYIHTHTHTHTYSAIYLFVRVIIAMYRKWGIEGTEAP